MYLSSVCRLRHAIALRPCPTLQVRWFPYFLFTVLLFYECLLEDLCTFVRVPQGAWVYHCRLIKRYSQAHCSHSYSHTHYPYTHTSHTHTSHTHTSHLTPHTLTPLTSHTCPSSFNDFDTQPWRPSIVCWRKSRYGRACTGIRARTCPSLEARQWLRRSQARGRLRLFFHERKHPGRC